MKTLDYYQNLAEGTPRLLEASRLAVDPLVLSPEVHKRGGNAPKIGKFVEISEAHKFKVKFDVISYIFCRPDMGDKMFRKHTETVSKAL